MEYADGGTLDAYLKKHGDLAGQAFTHLAFRIVDALSASHQIGIYHRDLKPANILLMKDFTIRVADFGVAKLTDLTTMTTSGSILGTMAYLPPEALDSFAPQDQRGDIWAMGMMLFKMLTGELAFDAPSQAGMIAAIIGSNPRPLTAVRPNAPPALELVIQRCLEKHPDLRYENADILLSELQKACGVISEDFQMSKAKDLWNMGQKSEATALLQAISHHPPCPRCPCKNPASLGISRTYEPRKISSITCAVCVAWTFGTVSGTFELVQCRPQIADQHQSRLECAVYRAKYFNWGENPN